MGHTGCVLKESLEVNGVHPTEDFLCAILHGQESLPELGHSCSALAMRVLAMFFSPARYSSRTDSNLGKQAQGWDISIYHSITNHSSWPSARDPVKRLLHFYFIITVMPPHMCGSQRTTSGNCFQQ